MTALTADFNARTRPGGSMRVDAYPVAASTTIYKGGIVAINSSGYAVPAGDTAGHRVAGIAVKKADNASGSAGDIDVQVESLVVVRLPATSITQAMLFDPVYVVDDNTVDDAAGATNEVFAGYLVEYESATAGWVLIPGPHATPDLSVATADIQANAVTGAKVATNLIVAEVIAGGAAGALTVTGIATTDTLIGVIRFDLDATASNIDVDDLTSEFSITAADTIDNTGGTATTGDKLLVLYLNAA